MREVRRHVTVREISEHLGYPLSSAQVLLKSISTLGYLRYDSNKRAYLATPRLAAIGDWVTESMLESGIDFATLERIAAATGLTTILGVENDIYVQYIHVVLGSEGRQFRVQPGTRRLLCMSGLGWALLSTATPEHVAKLIHRSNVRLSPGGQSIDPAEVNAHVSETREKGYAYSRGTVSPTTGIIGLVTAVHPSSTRFAVGVGGDLDKLDQNRDFIVRTIREHLTPLGLDPVEPDA